MRAYAIQLPQGNISSTNTHCGDEGTSVKSFYFSIFSSLGDLVMQGQSYEKSLSLDFLREGIYFIKIQGLSTPFKVIKIK